MRKAWAVPATVVTCALLAVGCGSSKGSASSAASSIAANPTVSADAAAARAAGQKALDACVTALGGTPAPGISALTTPAMLRQLRDKANRQTCINAAVPDPAKREALKGCLADAAHVFLLHPGAIAGNSSGSVERRHTAGQAAFACFEDAAK